MPYFAHTAEDDQGQRSPQEHWQPLKDHLQAVAELAAQFGAPMGMAEEARLAGLLHDLGKYAERFQERLRNPKVHGINHWAAGTIHAFDVLKAALVGYAVDGHHTGVPAQADVAQTRERAKRPSHWAGFTGCWEPLEDLLSRFLADGLLLPALQPGYGKDHFANALRVRFVFSCLTDADFLDTERHFQPTAAAQRCSPPLRAGRALEILMSELGRKPKEGLVNGLRRRLLDDCLAAARQAPGLFTLTAPTGSGKTLASLAFALQHLVRHNSSLAEQDTRRFRRVIVVVPYTSIIEQTARVYRDLFEAGFGPQYVLEHHSAVTPRERDNEPERDAEEQRLRRARLAAENWDAPLIVTTSVQFFESLFANKPSDCRKLHNIARSVVLFDEVQTLPANLVPSLLSAVQLLAQEPYGVTAVFMTATQPAFESAAHALPYGWEPREISSSPRAMADGLCRTSISLPPKDEALPWHELAAELASHSQVLCVVNSTKDARDLFRLLPKEGRFHLSARLCPAHRQMKLREIRERLAGDSACRLVSTQLIEAGVDVDFPAAYRAMGPLDSIIQTAGRCNREGRHAEPCPVRIFRPKDGGTPPGAYRVAAAKTVEFLARHPDASLHQPELYRQYFAELYGLLGPKAADADAVYAASKAFDFPKAAEECRLVGEDTRSVLVKWREGEALINKLRHEKHLLPEEWRQVQRFTLNLHLGEFLAAEAQGYIVEAIEGVWLWNSQYDDDLGACHAGTDEYVC